MLKDRMKWPHNTNCAAMITVNLEAQYFAKMYYPDDEININEGEIYMSAKEGIETGLPKILEVLDRYGVKATFFVLAATAEEYPEIVKDIADRGHEFGCHGYYHENLAKLDSKTQRNILKSAKEKIEEICGKKVTGFRMPEGEITEETLKIVKELGFTYSSSLSDNDIPYINKSCNLIEIPIRWELYDLPYYAYAFEPMIPQGQDRISNVEDVLSNWIIELDAARAFSTLFNLQIDPQATGEQGRIFVLKEILERIKSDDKIWLTTGNEIAELFV